MENKEKECIIKFTEWLVNLMIVETADGYVFRSSMIGGEKYSPEQLYNKYKGASKLYSTLDIHGKYLMLSDKEKIKVLMSALDYKDHTPNLTQMVAIASAMGYKPYKDLFIKI